MEQKIDSENRSKNRSQHSAGQNQHSTSLDAGIDAIDDYIFDLNRMIHKSDPQPVFKAALKPLKRIIHFEAVGFTAPDEKNNQAIVCWTPDTGLEVLMKAKYYLEQRQLLATASQSRTPQITPWVEANKTLVFGALFNNSDNYGVLVGIVKNHAITSIHLRLISILLHISTQVIDRITFNQRVRTKINDLKWALPDGMQTAPGRVITKEEVLKQNLSPPPSSPLPGSNVLDCVLPVYLPGIDFCCGLDNVNGNIDQFIKLLAQYEQAFSDSADKLRHIIQTGDLDSGKRLITGLMGVASDLGAKDLFITATAIEKAFRQCDDGNFSGLMDRFETAHKTLLATIAEIQRWAADNTEILNSARDDIQTAKVLADIKALLLENDLIDEAYLLLLKCGNQDPNWLEKVHLLETHIANYQYDKALLVINALNPAK